MSTLAWFLMIILCVRVGADTQRSDDDQKIGAIQKAHDQLKTARSVYQAQQTLHAQAAAHVRTFEYGGEILRSDQIAYDAAILDEQTMKAILDVYEQPLLLAQQEYNDLVSPPAKLWWWFFCLVATLVFVFVVMTLIASVAPFIYLFH